MKLFMIVVTGFLVTLMAAPRKASAEIWTYYDAAAESCASLTIQNNGCSVHFDPLDFNYQGEYSIDQVYLTSAIPSGQTVTLTIGDHYLHATPPAPRFYRQEFVTGGTGTDTLTLAEPLHWIGEFYVRLDYEAQTSIPFPSSWSEDAIRRNQVAEIGVGWVPNVCDFAISVAVNELTGIGKGEPPTLPRGFELFQNYPNPFNPTTTIEVDISEGYSGGVSLFIYDLRGRQVRRLINGEMEAGRHRVVWDGRNEAGEHVTSGIYLYTLRTGDSVYNRKMTMLK